MLQKLISQLKINFILSQFDSYHNQGCTLPKGKLFSSILGPLVSLPGASGFNGLPLPAFKLYMFSIALFLVNKTRVLLGSEQAGSKAIKVHFIAFVGPVV